MYVLLGFAFLSGLVTILAPCIWPLLPIVLSTSIAGKGKKRPLGITLGIMASFTIFTLTISALVRIFQFDPNLLRTVAVVVIFALGLTMLIPQLSNIFELAVGKLTRLLPSGQTSGGFVGGFVTGFTLGIVWSPCAGPILASIAALAATGQVTLSVVAVTLAYVTGVGIPLFLFAYGGQYIILRTRVISTYTGTIQRIFGVVMIIASILIYTNYDKQLQANLLNRFPFLDSALTSFEKSETVKTQLEALKGNMPSQNTSSVGNSQLFNAHMNAPEFKGITKWLNPELPLTMDALKGKVVLVDFWTYTCINCIRTLPYVTSWYDKYKDQGFVVIGVHTPEFAFEKDTNNVLAAIKQYNIHYPVAQDNDYRTWQSFDNQYWPAEYLIDAQGVIRRTHFGEGEYDEMEEAIQQLLKENGKTADMPLSDIQDQTPTSRISPESYVGSERMLYLWPSGQIETGPQTFTLPLTFPVNSFVFGGTWNINDAYSLSTPGSDLEYHFHASKVFLVMKPHDGASHVVKVTVDGIKANGADVKDGNLIVDKDRLYELVNYGSEAPTDHTVKLHFTDGEVEVYAFTFG